MSRSPLARLATAFGAASLAACATPQAPAAQPETVATTSADTAGLGTPAIHASYRGVFHARHMLDPESGRMTLADTPPRVIRDASEMIDFVALIPRDTITKTHPAPPSDDPLLGSPTIDWSRHMVLVGFRSDTMYGDVVFENLRRDGDDLRVRVLTPEPGPERFGAQPMGVGAYHAIVVDRVPGTVHFEP